MAHLAAIAAVVGTVVSAAGTIASGQAAKDDANFQAKQLDIRAKEETAAAQREALQQKKETQLVQSRGQAVAASSGLGALDESVLELAGDVEQEGAYRESLIRYGGEERARGTRGQADAARASGAAAAKGSIFSAVGTLASGFGKTFAGKYGGAGPSPDKGAPLDLLSSGRNSYFYQ